MSRYRANLVHGNGTTERRPITRYEWDAIVDAHLERRGAYLAASRERYNTRLGEWRVDDEGWDLRPAPAPAPPSVEEQRAAAAAERSREMLAVAAFNDRIDRQQRRRSYYERTGR